MVTKRLCVWSACATIMTLAAEGGVSSDKRVSFYLVKDAPTPFDLKTTALRDILLEERPLFTSDDVIKYDIRSHSFTLSQEARERLCQLRVSVITGRPFVVMVGNGRVYA